MSADPEAVVRAILSVRQAMERWQAAAKDAVEAGRDEYDATSARVGSSSRAAMEARVGAENLGDELGRLGSALEGARSGLMAATAAVEARSRKHAELEDHVKKTQEAWRGNVWRAQGDYQAASVQRAEAEQLLAAADGQRQAARSRLQSARSDAEQAGALAELRQTEAEYGAAYARYQQALQWENEQAARVQRCQGALSLAEQAVAELEGAAKDVGTATTAVATARAQLAEVEAAITIAHEHLGRMVRGADEAVSQANRANQDLSAATQHLNEVVDWHRQGHLLAMDAGDEMADIVQQLRHLDRPMDGGGAANVRPASAAGVRNTPDQSTVIQLAKDARRRGGVTVDEGRSLRAQADRAGVRYRPALTKPYEAHPARGFGSRPHIHVGPVNHIPVLVNPKETSDAHSG